MAEPVDQLVKLDLGYVPRADVASAVLVQTEGRTTLLAFNAVRTGEGGAHRAGTALVEFHGLLCSRFGHPHDVTLPGHPLYASGLRAYGIYEVLNPSWTRRLEERNRAVHPRTGEWDFRHFIITFYDGTFECLAKGMEPTLLDEPPARIFRRIARRVLNE